MEMTLLRTLALYGVILLAVRLMGKRQISQLQTSELVVTLLISELAVLPIQDRQPLWSGLLPMAVLVVCEIVVSRLMLRFPGLRHLLCGRPTLVIRDGKVLPQQMKKLRMSTEELFEELRLDGVFTLEEVAWAVVETNGTMTVLRRPQDDALTPRQAGVKVAPQPPELVVVSDGKIAHGSLALCGLDEAWVRSQAKAAGLSVGQVFLMTATPQGKSQILPKGKSPPKP